MCSGNVCRSPMAEALLRRALATHGVDARVSSAGTMHWPGGATPEAVAVMDERGVDLRNHQSRPLSAERLATADLVLGMTRTHVDVAATRGGTGVAARTFLVGEAARLARSVGARGPGEPARDWVARLDAARDGPYGRAVDEVPDPVGEPLERYRVTAAVLDRHISALVPCLAGAVPASRRPSS